MEDVKRLGFPLLIIVLSAFLSRLLETYLHGSFVHTLMVILIVIALFLFGVSLNKSRKKRSNAVFKKVVAILVVILMLFMQLGYFTLPIMQNVFTLIGIDAFYMNMLYIFCGYLFVD